jgi:hypothetical protein
MGEVAHAAQRRRKRRAIAELRSSTRTRYPAARAALAMADPTKPLAPVTRKRSRPLGLASMPETSNAAARTRRELDRRN